MSGEIGSVGFDRYDQDYENSFGINNPIHSKFHEVIFYQQHDPRKLSNKDILQTYRTDVTDRTNCVAQKRNIVPMESTVQGEVGGKISWGGNNGIEASAYAKIDAHNTKGDYAQIQIEQKNDGRGNATVAAGHKENPKL